MDFKVWLISFYFFLQFFWICFNC